MLFAGIFTAGLLAVGCGGSSEGTITTHVAKATFLKQANATCARTYDRIKAKYQSFVQDAGPKPFSTDQEVREYDYTVMVPAKRREVEELRALGAPSGDEEKVEAILAAYDEGIETAEEDPHAAIISAFGVFVKATKLAEAYGLEECHY